MPIPSQGEGWALFDQKKRDKVLESRNSRLQDRPLQKGRGRHGVVRG